MIAHLLFLFSASALFAGGTYLYAVPRRRWHVGAGVSLILAGVYIVYGWAVAQ